MSRSQVVCPLSNFGLVAEEQQGGLFIRELKPLSVAHLLGFRVGWRIVSMPGGGEVTPQRLAEAIREALVNRKVEIKLGMNDQRGRSREVILPQPVSLPKKQRRFRQRVSREGGLTVDFCSHYGYREAFVSYVARGSRAEKCGFRLLDRIKSINGEPVDSLVSFYWLTEQGDSWNFEIEDRLGYRENLELKDGMLVPFWGQLERERVGRVGEDLVSERLKEMGGNYTELRNIILPSTNGRGTQIDHILVGPNGVFVMETKYLNGHISGHVRDENWSQMTPNGERRRLFNPIWQNNFHMWAVERLLEEEGLRLPVYSVVVLLNCTMNVRAPVPVVGLEQLNDCIRSKRRQVILPAMVPVIADKIQKKKLLSFFVRQMDWEPQPWEELSPELDSG